jgi:hypothetical protein
MALPPLDILLDNNLLVATGMAICRSVMKSALAVFTSNPLVTICKLSVILLLVLFFLIQLSLVFKLHALTCALPRHTIATKVLVLPKIVCTYEILYAHYKMTTILLC